VAPHWPAWHSLAAEHSLASSHVVPFTTFVVVQPVDGSHASVVHGLLSLQLIAGPGEQVPASHSSSCVHALPSLQAVPSGAGACWQPPVVEQVSVVHGSLSAQSSPMPAVHVPVSHASAPLQALPSRHGVPSVAGACWQPRAALQLSKVHGFASSQLVGVPALQLPAWQISPPLQRLPSGHGVPFGALATVHPLAGLQLSVVQAFPSLQVIAVFWQAPAVQVSAVQALESAQLWQIAPASPHVFTLVPVAQAPPASQQLCPVQQVGDEPQQCPELLPFVQTAPALPAGCWQVVLAPLHTSSVHALPSSRQGSPSPSTPSDGHPELVPVHVSAASQAPFAVRHTVPVAYVLHRPCALQVPSVPQLGGP
jgi:hypothetical protein